MCAFNPCSKAFTHSPLICNSSSITRHFNEKLRITLHNVLVLTQQNAAYVWHKFHFMNLLWVIFPTFFCAAAEDTEDLQQMLNNAVKDKTIMNSLNTCKKWTLSKGI